VPLPVDALHGLNQLMVKDPAIVWAGDGAKLNTAIVSLERLDLFGSIGRSGHIAGLIPARAAGSCRR